MPARTDGVIYACHPCYPSAVLRDSSRQFWARAVNPQGPYAKMLSQFDDGGSSLLADAFNHHWKTALNLQLQGTPVTRFVMLHADIVPEDFWMDKLLAELDANEADVVAAVVPIKDGRGLTSTAIDDQDDPWEVYRRLTMAEVYRLPETFAALDCARLFSSQWKEKGHTVESWPIVRGLLVNTGCWVADFTKPWRFHVEFEIRNRIAFCQAPGEELLSCSQYREGMKGFFVNQVMPEDWGFSRQLAKLGARVMATRKVALSHVGDFPYPSGRGDWGQWESDQTLRKKWDQSWKEIPQIEGWLTETEGRALAELANKKTVLEIGSWCGLSTVWMARKAELVMAVDTFDGRGTPTPRNTYDEFQANIRKYEVENKVRVVKGESKHALPEGDFAEFFDLAFIDGAHDLASLRTDLRLALRTLRPGGLLVFHDYQNYQYPEVSTFIHNLLEDAYELIKQVGTLVVLRPVYPWVVNGETLNTPQHWESKEAAAP